ncbi:DUF1592 domain-containing protein [Rosistilla oblonga]|uniref:DUF1592 domain-containing protein n=1 Tax=Rosistilla oblonga TaxID=2527990 RepID=UPI003A97C42A
MNDSSLFSSVAAKHHRIANRSRSVHLQFRWLLPSLLLSVFATACSAADLDKILKSELQPLLKTYCLDCHDAASAEGGVALETPASALAMRMDRETWMRALRQVQAEVMPPSDSPEMPAADRAAMIHLIDEVANSVDCGPNVNPGKITLRRLNSSEYRNTIRELTGVDYTPAANFPGDDVGYGFDNIGDVLSLPPLLLEKYLQAAEEIMGQAIKTAPGAQLFSVQRPGENLGDADKYSTRNGSVSLSSSGEVYLQEKIPFGGQFELRLTAYGDQAGDEPVKFEVKVDGKLQRIVSVPASDPTDYTIKLRLSKGKHKISFAFTNDYYKPATDGKKGEDRNAAIAHVMLSGESKVDNSKVVGDLPATHRKLIFVTPSRDRTPESAAAEVIQRFASRAFRRPATNDEIRRLGMLAAEVRNDGGTFDESIQVAFQAVLVSPHFLYKFEQPRQPDANGVYPPVNAFELAARLSYFLWSSMPDEELFKLAWNDSLHDPEVLAGQVHRMLKDPRSVLMVDNFASQWLQLRNLSKSNPDQSQFPEFDDEIRGLLRRETLTFFAAVMRYDRPITELLDGRFTYLNERLAKFYGVPGISGDEFQFVRFEDGVRGGLLTQASILTVTSNPTRTSPVKRGKWILDNILGTPPPPAPPNVPELERSELTGTMRQRLVQHRDNPACASCHKLMDPLGFALENFDAIGQWRQQQDGLPVDASGELPGGIKITGVEDLRKVLVEQQREQFVRCVTEKLLTFALGRGLEYYDKCAVDKIQNRLAANDYRFSELILGIVQSDPFQKQGVRQ